MTDADRMKRINGAETFPLCTPNFATDVAVSTGALVLAEGTHRADPSYSTLAEVVAWRSRLTKLLRSTPYAELPEAS